MGAGVSDEDAPPVEVGAIEHDLRVDFPGRGQFGGDVPAPVGLTGERAYGDVEAAASAGAGDPVVVGVELGLAGDVGAGLCGRGAAGFAAPSSAASAGLAVLDELVGAYTTGGVIPRKGHWTCFQSMSRWLLP